MKVLLIYNPFASHGRAKKILPQVERRFVDQGVSFELRLTDYPEHAIEIVREAEFSDYDGIVAAGGDGTLFEVINGYYKNPARGQIPIGVLPIGTGNAFARDLELDGECWQDAVDIVKLNKPRRVDVGRFRTHGQDYYFLNIIGAGFVADVNKIAQKLKIIGNLSYTIGVLLQTAFLKAFPLVMKLDGLTRTQENIFVEISNTRYTANFLMAPNAEIDDGFLDVTIVPKINRRRLISCFPKIFTGEHIHLPEVEQVKAKSISLETKSPKVLTPDGELVGITPVQVDCLHRDVEVFWK